MSVTFEQLEKANGYSGRDRTHNVEVTSRTGIHSGETGKWYTSGYVAFKSGNHVERRILVRSWGSAGQRGRVKVISDLEPDVALDQYQKNIEQKSRRHRAGHYNFESEKKQVVFRNFDGDFHDLFHPKPGPSEALLINVGDRMKKWVGTNPSHSNPSHWDDKEDEKAALIAHQAQVMEELRVVMESEQSYGESWGSFS